MLANGLRYALLPNSTPKRRIVANLPLQRERWCGQAADGKRARAQASSPLAARAGGRQASGLLGMQAVMLCRRRALSCVSSDLEGSGTGMLCERCVSNWKAACAVKELHTSLVPAYLETVGMLPSWTACGSHACHACADQEMDSF